MNCMRVAAYVTKETMTFASAATGLDEAASTGSALATPLFSDTSEWHRPAVTPTHTPFLTVSKATNIYSLLQRADPHPTTMSHILTRPADYNPVPFVPIAQTTRLTASGNATSATKANGVSAILASILEIAAHTLFFRWH